MMYEEMQEIIDYFEKLPPDRINQKRGRFLDEESSCCVGAHLAHLLAGKRRCEIAPALVTKIMRKKFAQINEAHLFVMLRKAGAPRNFIGGEKWSNPPVAIFKKLQQMEKLPSLKKANLSGFFLEGANLTGANLSGANLSGADLERANLSGANLSGANLSGANLCRANLEGAFLREANFAGANLENTRF